MTTSTLNVEQVTGGDLRQLRVGARLRQSDVAAQLGISRQRIHELETRAVVTPRSAKRYVDALATALAAAMAEAGP